MKKLCVLFVIAMLLTAGVVILERLTVKETVKEKPSAIPLRTPAEMDKQDPIHLIPKPSHKVVFPLDDSNEGNNIVNINETYNYTDDQIDLPDIEEESGEGDDTQGEVDNEFTGASLTFGQIDYENNIIEIFMTNNEEVAGFQFALSSNNNGLIVSGAFGGLAAEFEMDVMVGDQTNIILGMSLEGYRIALANDVLTNLSFETLNTTDTEICISDLIISNAAGDNITTEEQSCTNLN